MNPYARSSYQAQAAETAGPAQLVLMLYDGALSAVARARQAHDLQTINRELLRAQDIVTELSVTLDHERGGPMAGNLAALYQFCLDRLVEANVNKDVDDLDAVSSLLQGVRDAWDEACVRSGAGA